jgi:VanW like protein
MNAPGGQHGPTKAGTAHPSKTAVLSFLFRSTALQSKRLVADTLWRDRPLKNGNDEEFPFVVAESVSPLRTNTDSRERYLQLGKIENLRLACRQIHCKVLAPGDTFSFWRQVGGPWRDSCPNDLEELVEDVIHSINRLRNSTYKLRGCIVQSELPSFLR